MNGINGRRRIGRAISGCGAGAALLYGKNRLTALQVAAPTPAKFQLRSQVKLD
jgi:hypothetical protein